MTFRHADVSPMLLQNKVIYLPSPTWGNHNKIFPNGGIAVKHYRYYLPATRGLDFAGTFLMPEAVAINSSEWLKDGMWSSLLRGAAFLFCVVKCCLLSSFMCAMTLAQGCARTCEPLPTAASFYCMHAPTTPQALTRPRSNGSPSVPLCGSRAISRSSTPHTRCRHRPYDLPELLTSSGLFAGCSARLFPRLRSGKVFGRILAAIGCSSGDCCLWERSSVCS